jgi:hypothetical protein
LEGDKKMGWARWIVGLVSLLLALMSGEGSAADETPVQPLPRTFEGVWLGIRAEQLARLQPGISPRLMPGRHGYVLVAPSSDPRIQRLEYRFHNGSLYELRILYNPERLPGGKAALLRRLKELYGRPAVDGLEEYDPGPLTLSQKRTVWEDDATRVSAIERRKLVEAEYRTEVLLVVADRELERQHLEAVEEERRRGEEDIPIPMPDRVQRLEPRTGRGGRGVAL